MKRLSALALVLLLAVSCGSDNKTGIAQQIPFTPNDIDMFMTQVSNSSTNLRVGQKKVVREQHKRKGRNGGMCLYWTTVTEEITSTAFPPFGGRPSVQIRKTSKSQLLPNQPFGCSTFSTRDGSSTRYHNTNDLIQSLREEVRRFIDHDYRCRKMRSRCVDSRLISATEGLIGGVPVVRVVTQYDRAIRNGQRFTTELTAYVSKRNLFEGVLKFERRNLSTNEVTAVRDFLFTTL